MMVKDFITPALCKQKIRAIEGLKRRTVHKFFTEFRESFVPQAWSGVCFLWLEDDLQELRNFAVILIRKCFLACIVFPINPDCCRDGCSLMI